MDCLLKSYNRMIDRRVNAALGFGRVGARSLEYGIPLRPPKAKLDLSPEENARYNNLLARDRELATQVDQLLEARTATQNQGNRILKC